MSFEELLQIPPYSLDKMEKEKLLTGRLAELTELHRCHCPEYADILNILSYGEQKNRSYKEIPFIPVRLFKELSLKSVSDGDIVKTMTSSGTSGQRVSRIYLDRTTASNQQKAMVKIVSDFTGSGRMPMLIIDCPSVVKNRAMFSARGAGILGFSIFGSNRTGIPYKYNLSAQPCHSNHGSHPARRHPLGGCEIPPDLPPPKAAFSTHRHESKSHLTDRARTSACEYLFGCDNPQGD